MAIVSSARTAQIIEEVADKHGLDVATMLCAAWRRDMILARSEVVHRLRTEQKLSFVVIADKLGTVPSRAHSLLREWNRREAQARLFIQTPDPDGRIRELEAEIARLSGTYLAEKLAARLDVKLRCAILLAILAEAYPRYVRGPALLALYDEAREKLGYGGDANGSRVGASFDLLTKNACDLLTRFREAGWPTPTEVGPHKGSRRLTDACAEWLSGVAGAPRRSAVEMWKESQEREAGSLAVRVAVA